MRRLFRKSDGTFRRGQLSDLGVSCDWCPKCGIGNPSAIGEQKPEKCHSCGSFLAPIAGQEPSK